MTDLKLKLTAAYLDTAEPLYLEAVRRIDALEAENGKVR
jgi:hypothetical protein